MTDVESIVGCYDFGLEILQMQKELIEFKIKNPDKNADASAKRIERLIRYQECFSVMIEFFTTCNALNAKLETDLNKISKEYGDLLARIEIEKQMEEL